MGALMNAEFNRRIGEFLRKQRLRRGLSEPFVAAAVGYRHGGTVRRIEEGHLPLPFSKVDRFAEVLGIGSERLLDAIRKLQTDLPSSSGVPSSDPLPKSLARKISKLRRSREFWERVRDAEAASGNILK